METIYKAQKIEQLFRVCTLRNDRRQPTFAPFAFDEVSAEDGVMITM